MDDRTTRVLAAVSDETLAKVAAGALGVPEAHLDGAPEFTEIRKPHAEDRTIAIVRVAGTAGGQAWSSVIKLVDLAIPAAERVVGLTLPENEELVYERRLFVEENLPFRPARCYAVTRPEGQLKLLWLEDLTGARGSPFALEQIAQMASHIGEWNGRHSGPLPALGIPIGRDAFVRRITGWNFGQRFAELDRYREHPFVRSTFRGSEPGILHSLLATTNRLIDRVLGARHALAFGDCSAGNLFHLPTQTVAIDWASLTDDPTGVDGGCFIGSNFSWGRDFMDVVRAERELFDAYLGGLRQGGWSGDPLDIRRAGLAQMAGYLLVTSITPSMLVAGSDWLQSFLEGRFGLPTEEICARLSDLVAMVPRFTDEIEALL
jgi:hypothetical protein